MSKLFESDFQTVDIKSLFNNQKELKSETDSNVNAEDNQGAAPKSLEDWEALLDTQIKKNRSLGHEAREPEHVVETKIFEDFFKSNWDAECARQLLSIGDLLRKAIKVLGFDETNPILAFISNNYVKENIIRPGLLNSSTFKAIYEAVSENLVADSEFFRPNNYNIIYCKDLYTKTSKEILEYLKLQKKILMIHDNKYRAEDVRNNKKRG